MLTVSGEHEFTACVSLDSVEEAATQLARIFKSSTARRPDGGQPLPLATCLGIRLSGTLPKGTPANILPHHASADPSTPRVISPASCALFPSHVVVLRLEPMPRGLQHHLQCRDYTLAPLAFRR